VSGEMGEGSVWSFLTMGLADGGGFLFEGSTVVRLEPSVERSILVPTNRADSAPTVPGMSVPGAKRFRKKNTGWGSDYLDRGSNGRSAGTPAL
jgi:hypothetical protein